MLQKKTEGEFANHTMCRQGKWNYEGERYFAKLDGYTQMEKPHANDHKYGKAAVKKYHQGLIAEGIQDISLMEKYSMEVLQCLEKNGYFKLAFIR